MKARTAQERAQAIAETLLWPADAIPQYRIDVTARIERAIKDHAREALARVKARKRR